jgi:hypothetical protein
MDRELGYRLRERRARIGGQKEVINGSRTPVSLCHDSFCLLIERPTDSYFAILETACLRQEF